MIEPIFLQLSSGEINLFPTATVYDIAGNLLSVVNLFHVSAGLYRNDFPILPTSVYIIQFKVYTDSGHTIASLNYFTDIESVNHREPISTEYAVVTVTSTEIVQITNFNTNLSLLLEQYKQSENIKGVLSLMNTQALSLENALFEIRDNFWLSTAVGVQLDVLGLVLNYPRLGLSDTNYRIALIEKASLILASGEPDVIIAIIKLIYGATFVSFAPGYPMIPASFYIITDGTITLTELLRLTPSGVNAMLGIYLLFEDDSFITFEDGSHLFCVS